jgi:hypothetical protein
LSPSTSPELGNKETLEFVRLQMWWLENQNELILCLICSKFHFVCILEDLHVFLAIKRTPNFPISAQKSQNTL